MVNVYSAHAGICNIDTGTLEVILRRGKVKIEDNGGDESNQGTLNACM
jgi:hypothetical protein